MSAVPCSIVRGGTTKGVFFLAEHLPADPAKRDELLLAVMGSPDVRQIDGLGGADPLTSKAVIVERSHRPGIDLEYESIEVGIADASVNHGIMCGNLLSAVGYFGIAEGLVQPRSPSSTFRVYVRNNGKTIVATMPVPLDATADRDALVESLSGSATVALAFEKPTAAVTGRLLPTGSPVDTLSLPGGATMKFSVVDSGTLYAFLPAAMFGLTGREAANALDEQHEFRETVEYARAAIAAHINARMGTESLDLAPKRLKIAIVGPPGPLAAEADIAARVINTAKVHKAYAVSGAICLSTAALIPGSVVSEMVEPSASPCTIRIAHPSGVLDLITYYEGSTASMCVQKVEIHRTARILMRGTVYVPAA